jgi:hypothetical protein
MTKVKTEVSEVLVDNLTDLLGDPTQSVILPDNKKEEKPNLFSSTRVDTSFLDNAQEEEEENPDDKKPEGSDEEPTKKELKPEEIDDALQFEEDDDDEEEEEESSSFLSKTLEKLIEKNIIVPFEDDKPISEYSEKDIEELLQANLDQKKEEVRDEVAKEFFDNMPEEFQFAAKYFADGGQDLKSLFRHMAEQKEIAELDLSDDSNREVVIREYLSATRYGTPEEIEEEIESLKDRGDLEKKANQFKPKLEKMREQVVLDKIKKQEELKTKSVEKARNFMQSVYKTLEPGELGGVKLDAKTQNMLYAGLVQPNYPSISGKPTNLLGHLLEKYQVVEPNLALVSEALWLLSNPEEYKEKIRTAVKVEVDTQTKRTLKTEAGRQTLAADLKQDKEDNKITKKKGIQRGKPNFFKRPE